MQSKCWFFIIEIDWRHRLFAPRTNPLVFRVRDVIVITAAADQGLHATRASMQMAGKPGRESLDEFHLEKIAAYFFNSQTFFDVQHTLWHVF